MRHTLLTAVAAVALAAPLAAQAADMPVKAVPYIAPEYNWSGIYVGLNAGWVREHEDWTYTNPVPATFPTNAVHGISRDDGIFGAHAGIQYQFSHIVVGAEAAISHPTDSKFGVSGTQCVATVGSLCEARAQTLITAGGRLGWAWDRWLLFASGGWAQLNIDTRELTAPPVVFDYSTAHNHRGSYVGGGVEYAWLDTLIVGVEYQHIDVGTVYHPSSADAFGPSPPGVNGRNVSGTEDIVRARISLKGNVGWPGAVFARY